MRTASKVKVFEDERLLVSKLEGAGDRLVVAFSGVGGRVGGLQNEEFAGTASGADNSVLFVTDKLRSWYNAPGLFEQILDILKEDMALRGYGRVATVGNSMGGFGAAVFARDLGADAALAFVPQFSIDPAVVPGEPRWREWRDRIDEIRVPTINHYLGDHTTYTLLFGGEGADGLHWPLLDLRKNVRAYVFPEQAHGVAQMMKADGVLGNCLAAALAGDRKRLGGLVRGYGARRLKPA